MIKTFFAYHLTEEGHIDKKMKRKIRKLFEGKEISKETLEDEQNAQSKKGVKLSTRTCLTIIFSSFQ
jgi:hypothetical protein